MGTFVFNQKNRVGFRLLIALLGIACAIPLISAQTSGPGKFKPRRVLKGQPAITNPGTLTVEQITDEVTDEELVIGLALNGQARAYPINMLTGPSREIINDTIGGTPIAATW